MEKGKAAISGEGGRGEEKADEGGKKVQWKTFYVSRLLNAAGSILAMLWQRPGNVLAASAAACAAAAAAANDTNIKCHKVWRLCRGLSTTHKYAHQVGVGVCVCLCACRCECVSTF